MNRLQLLHRLEERWQALLASYSGLSTAGLTEPGVTGEWSVAENRTQLT